MTGGLFFGTSDDWLVSGWIFERLLQRAIEEAQVDAELEALLATALLHDGLFFDRLDPVLAEKATSLIKRVAMSELRRDHEDLKPSDVKMYREALSTLLELIANL